MSVSSLNDDFDLMQDKSRDGADCSWAQLPESRHDQLTGQTTDIDLMEQFQEQGFIHLKRSIPTQTIAWAQEVMVEKLSEMLGKGVTLVDGLRDANDGREQFLVQEDLGRDLDQRGLYTKVFLEAPVLSALMGLLGPDLAYMRDLQIAANFKGVTEKYYLKPFHQEVWSGASPQSVYCWFPLHIKAGMGNLEFIPGSHTWGLLPNRDREPLELPPEARTVLLDIEEGDSIIFHTLTMHRTVPNLHDEPRLAATTNIRNFHHQAGGHEHLRSWQIFHSSPMTNVQRTLGNPYLTPFRTLGAKRSVFT